MRQWTWPSLDARTGLGPLIETLNRRLRDLVLALRGKQSSLGWINVKDYGATGNGVANDTAAVVAAVAAARAGDTIFFPRGSYRLDPIQITKAVRLSGYGATIIANSADVDAATFRFTGTTDASSAVLTADAADGDLDLSVDDATDFPAETWFRLEDTSAGGSDFAYEWHQVKRVSGTTLSLTDPVDGAWPYPTTDTTLAVWHPIEDPVVEGFRCEGAALQAVGWALVAFEHCLRPVCRDVTVHEFGTYGVRFTACRDWQMIGGGAMDATCDLSLASGADAGYGLLMEDGSMHGTVTGGSFRNCRHGIIGATGARYWRAVNNTVVGSYAAAITTHFRRAVDIAYLGNTITGSVGKSPSSSTLPTLGQGLTASTTDTRVTMIGNTISHVLGSGIYCSQSALGDADWIIQGNTLVNCAPTATQSEASLYVANGRHVQIAQNVIRRTDTVAFSGLRVQGCEDVGLSGNDIVFTSAQGATAQIGLRIVNSKRVTGLGNQVTLDGASVQGFRVVSTASGDSDRVHLSGNIATVSGGGSAMVADANATNVTELGNSWNHDGDSDHTMPGDVAIGGDLSVAGGMIELSDAAGTVRDVRLQTAGVNRWILRANATAESGSDAGTDFELYARDDSGSPIDIPLTVTRAAGGRATWTRANVFPAATTANPSLRAPHGTAPTSPTNGDVWTTTAGMYVRINGATVGPLGTGGGGGGSGWSAISAVGL